MMLLLFGFSENINISLHSETFFYHFWIRVRIQFRRRECCLYWMWAIS